MSIVSPGSPAPRFRRRWFQFGLRGLLLVVMLCGCGLGWVGGRMLAVQRRQAAIAIIGERRGSVVFDPPGFDPAEQSWTLSLGRMLFPRRVTEVDLTYCFADDFDMEQLRALPHLNVLRLSGTQVTDAGLQSIRRFEELEVLDVMLLKLTNGGVDALRDLTALKKLDLCLTRIDDSAIEVLGNLKQLETLNLYGTEIRAAGLVKLQAALPQCKIER